MNQRREFTLFSTECNEKKKISRLYFDCFPQSAKWKKSISYLNLYLFIYYICICACKYIIVISEDSEIAVTKYGIPLYPLYVST